MARILLWILGSLRLCVLGDGKERFVNLCTMKGIPIRNLRVCKNALYLTIKLKDFYRIRQTVRKTKVKVILKKRLGLPFLMRKMKRRGLFFLCFMMTILLWSAEGCFLWSVEYEGNEQITVDQLNDFCNRHEVKQLMPISKIDTNFLESELRREFPTITWACVTSKGSKMTISVKENTVKKENDQSEKGNINLISPYDGIVKAIVVRNGVPKVTRGNEVKKGEILIEGRVPVMDDGGSVKEWMEIPADGDVWMEHQIPLEETGSLFYLLERATGRKRMGIEVWKHGQKVFEFPRDGFQVENKLTERFLPYDLDQKLQIVKLRKTEHAEKHEILRKYEEKELVDLINEKLLRFLSSLEEKGVQIIEKNVRIDIEGDFWILYGSVKVLEKVTNEQEEE